MARDGFKYLKNFLFYTDDSIIEFIEQSEYKGSCKWFSTNIPSDRPDLISPDDDFENKLVENGIHYFAYIKFFKAHDKRYGIVAGRTKSKLVNPNGRSDVNFTKNLKYVPRTKWNAKEFLTINGFEWDKEEILVFIPKQSNIKLNAIKAERWLQNTFQLLGS